MKQVGERALDPAQVGGQEIGMALESASLTRLQSRCGFRYAGEVRLETFAVAVDIAVRRFFDAQGRHRSDNDYRHVTDAHGDGSCPRGRCRAP